MAFDELQFVEWLKGQCPAKPAIQSGIGDDMATLSLRSNRILVASDMLLEGVHFEIAKHSLEAVGRKAIARNLSDCAAMAVRPLAVTISVALPHTMSEIDARRLVSGMLAIAAEFDLAIAGGDTARWAGPLSIDVAICAEPFEGIGPVARSCARPGDRLFATGSLGGSIMGKHMSFTPRVHEARSLVEHFGTRLHAMIDISDGLSLDLWRMCRASGVGAQLEESLLRGVASEDAQRASVEDGRSVLEHVLDDGEDHELLIALAGDTEDSPTALWPVGHVTAGSDLKLHRLDGGIETINPGGFVHK